MPMSKQADIIAHLGIGNFQRAHQAVYTQHANTLSDSHWEIHGISLRSPTVRDTLSPQNYRYHVLEKSPADTQQQVISVIKNIVVAPESPDAVIELLANPDCKIVTLSITEKGYHTDSNGAVDYLVRALKQRMKKNIQPFTVISCDNINHNGAYLKSLCVELAASQDAVLADWIESQVAFPSTMVDRIVPATSDEDIALVAKQSSFTDNAVVPCEPFKQWVIQDHFCNERPEWELAGAQFVDDVTPYETLKLRLLNASHSALAYLGVAAGFDTIADAVKSSSLEKFIFDMMTEEIIPGLEIPAKFDVYAYRDSIIERFKNPSLKHKTTQVAMDGDKKIPLRILPSIEVARLKGLPHDKLESVVAAYHDYCLYTA
ncbi:MAG: mannitol dehydrogenase family protein [Coxiellaceae bacterium]|nr:mannitol dehydrogenase family protein [Coxiellaceae bacterium]